MSGVFSNSIIIVIISMIWGFGLALLFRRNCKNDHCVVVKVPYEFAKSNNTIYDNNINKCYQLEKYSSPCDY